jgi:fumarate hydratase class I
MIEFKESMTQLISATSSTLPRDVRSAIAQAMKQETPGSRAALALETIAVNVDLADERGAPICQDTGMPFFEIRTPIGVNQIAMKKQIAEAIVEATKAGKLRPNSVNPITGKNGGDNVGPGMPIVHFEQWEKEEIEVRLLLKGGGSENVSTQYSLPTELPFVGRADRSIEGIRKCILHAVFKAQGRGCSVGAIGVGIGGDRASGYELAKRQLFRELDDTNPDPELAQLEEDIVRSANTLEIGPMGFGGAVTLIGCKVGFNNRLPACFFVTVAYDCWAFRRLGVVIDPTTGMIKRWLYRDERPVHRMARSWSPSLTGHEIRLTAPLTEAQARSLHVGDVVLLNGLIHTGRDALHHHLVTHYSPVDLRGSVIYHCGPVALLENGNWRFTAAGPTTSIREESYTARILHKFGVRALVGKGGMGEKTLAALRECGAVYLNAIGGAAQYYADRIVRVEGVDFLEFGVPEAMWHIQVEDFPAIVTMDSHGQSLHKRVEEESVDQLVTLSVPAED